MYMLRAYQSPSSAADCGPQCAQMPNFASRNHSGTLYELSDSRVPVNGPLSIFNPAGGSANTFVRAAAGNAAPARVIALRRVSFIGLPMLCKRALQLREGVCWKLIVQL